MYLRRKPGKKKGMMNVLLHLLRMEVVLLCGWVFWGRMCWRFDSGQGNTEKRTMSFSFVKTHYLFCARNYQKMNIQQENNRKYFF